MPAGPVVVHDAVVAAEHAEEAAIVRIGEVDVLAGEDVGGEGEAGLQLADGVGAGRGPQLQLQRPQQLIQLIHHCIRLHAIR